MRLRSLAALLVTAAALPLAHASLAGQSSHGWLAPLREPISRLIAAAMADDFAWQRLAELTDTFGNRLSGSENLERAVAWAQESMRADGLENVRAERVMVPKWIRGSRERRDRGSRRITRLEILGLGGTVATPAGRHRGGRARWCRASTICGPRPAMARGRIVLLQRALRRLFGDGDLPHRWRTRGGAAWRGRRARARRGPNRAEDAAHGQRAVRAGPTRDSRGGRVGRGRQPDRPADRPRTPRAHQARDERQVRARRAVGQRGRGDPGPGAAGRDRAARRAPGLMGRRAPGRRTTASVAW